MKRFELSRLAALAPEASVSTIPPHPHNYLHACVSTFSTTLKVFDLRRMENHRIYLYLYLHK